ncbi:hypothetical protein [Aquimarina macrocephali]|uniref:hypothetical protein n=1 Tax=Aquimarina macrocephali TaxID=666563 RepID=UPI0004659A82|nr:hypothetical protein [Aquimarina macrocephali]
MFFVIKNKIDSSFLTQALFLLSIIQGILYLGLKRVSYDNEKIYFSNKVYGFNKIEKFYVFDQKISLFFVLKISGRSIFNRYVWFELIEDISVIPKLKNVFKPKTGVSQVEGFINLLNEKSNIPIEKKIKF